MPEATSERDGREDGDREREKQPPAGTRAAPEPDREVENYRDEYDLEKQDRPRPAKGQRS
jgi:hypothetical protein